MLDNESRTLAEKMLKGPGHELTWMNPTGFYCLDVSVPAQRDVCVRLLELRAEQVSIYVYVSMYICVCTYVCICACKCVYVYLCVRVCLCVYVCMYLICIFVYVCVRLAFLAAC
jgi:hypothetical protein